MPIDFENITDHTGVRIYNFDASKNVNEEEFDIIWNKLYTSYWKDELTYTEVSDVQLPSLEESSY